MSSLTINQAIHIALEHHKAGRLGDAEAIYRQILAVQPNHAPALHLLGVVSGQSGRHDLAVDLIRRAIAAAPGNADYHGNLGMFLQKQGQLEQAIACFQRAIEIKPDYHEAHNNLGIAWTDKGQLDQAIACFHRALQIKPDYADAHCNLGGVLLKKRQSDQAIACFRSALEIQPESSEIHNNIGMALKDKGQMDQAIPCYQRALEIKPNFAIAHNNLGSSWKDMGRLDEAIACFRQAVELNPRFIGASDNLLYTLLFHPASDAGSLFIESEKWNRQHAQPLTQFIQPHLNQRDPNRRLRVGYVSADFCDHASAFFLLPLFRSHDRQQFEVTCYAEAAYPCDDVTQRMRDQVQRWRPIIGLDDAQCAAMIRQDQIDILIDLKLHTANNRLLIFARKPAPVQVTWLGYPGTTGLKTIDYRLTDPYLDPPGLDDVFYSEQSIRLPKTFWCYDPLDAEPAVNALPADSNGYITFGCLNNFCKINDRVLSTWGRILKAKTGSKLLLRAPQGSCRQRVLDRLGGDGIAAERVEFVPKQSRSRYLQTHHRIDIGLDTWPCNGHTTSLDSFWMGVPVITLAGRTAVGRAGLSQLSNLGLGELVAHTPDAYVRIATDLAGDLPRLSKLRLILRQRMQNSPLMDAAAFTRAVESAYRDMWRQWCAGQTGSLGSPQAGQT